MTVVVSSHTAGEGGPISYKASPSGCSQPDPSASPPPNLALWGGDVGTACQTRSRSHGQHRPLGRPRSTARSFSYHLTFAARLMQRAASSQDGDILNGGMIERTQGRGGLREERRTFALRISANLHRAPSSATERAIKWAQGRQEGAWRVLDGHCGAKSGDYMCCKIYSSKS